MDAHPPYRPHPDARHPSRQTPSHPQLERSLPLDHVSSGSDVAQQLTARLEHLRTARKPLLHQAALPVSLTTIQGTRQMAPDKEAFCLSRVHTYQYSMCNRPHKIFVYSLLEHFKFVNNYGSCARHLCKRVGVFMIECLLSHNIFVRE